MNIAEAIEGRACRRAFSDKPVPHQIIHNILSIARWAPSGVNSQPWFVAVVEGETKQRMCNAIIKAYDANIPQNPDYNYYPTQWVEPYKARRFACGMALYGAVGIQRHETERRNEIWRLNYSFFGAPVGLMFYMDKVLNKGSWLDMGMFLQNVMLVAREFGLETCPQAALAEYPDIVREVLNISKDKDIVTGMALGYADMSQPINQYRTERESVENFTTWFK